MVTYSYKEPWHRNFFIILMSGFAFFVIEYIFKALAVMNLTDGPFTLTDFAALRFVPNTAMAFSLPVHQAVIIFLAGFILLALVRYFCICTRDGLYGHVWALNFIIWGAFSNLYDRINRGFVVDYMEIGMWPIFNLADVAIVAGFATLLALIAHEERKMAYRPLEALS